MKMIFRVLLFPIAWIMMIIMAWVFCFFTWGGMSWGSCYDSMWKEYWGGK